MDPAYKRLIRCKEAVTERLNERIAPYIVELPSPKSGVGHRLDLIAEWHREHGLQVRRGQSREDNGKVRDRFCFPRSEYADLFSNMFGGKRLAG